MSKDKSRVMLGAMIGAGLGYLAGLLTAPKAGSETRHDISEFAKKSTNQLVTKLEKVQTDLASVLKQAEAKLKSSKDTVEVNFVKAMDAAKKAKDQAVVVFKAVRAGDAEDEDLQKAIDEATEALNHLKTYLAKDKK